MASARWGTRQSISTKHGRTKCASSQQGNNIFRSSGANPARSRCVNGKLRIIAYRREARWPKDFHQVLGAEAFCAAMQTRGQTSRSRRAPARRSDRIAKAVMTAERVKPSSMEGEVPWLLDGR